MSSTYGERFRFTIFGQSHSPAIGVTMEGLPAGFAVDFDRLQAFLSRRAPGKSPTATARKEAHLPEFVPGRVGNVTCGAPLAALIPHTNTRSRAPTSPPRPATAGFRTWPAADTSPAG